MYQAATFGAILFALQQLAGTTLFFSECTFVFICLAAASFNITGGFTRASGAFIAGYALLGAIFGITWKAILWEPAQSNLQQPERTIEVYVGTIFSIFVAAWVARRVRLKKCYMPQFQSNAQMRQAAIGFLLVGGSAQIYLTLRTSTAGAGSFGAIFQQFSNLVVVAMLLAVFAEIRTSGGKRSMNFISLISGGFIFAGGIIFYSKQGMLTPFVCWLIPAAANRYKVSVVQVAGVAVAVGLITYYLVPYSQYGRSFRIEGASLSENLKVNALMLSNLEVVRRVNLERDLEARGDSSANYYNEPQGLADRLQMMTPDDLIIDYTDAGHVFGIEPTIFTYLNLIPHVIWKSKPIIHWGNVYANELGLLGGDDVGDTTTGVSFSPGGDAYHQAKWLGVLVMMPVLCFLLFFVVDGVCGDSRNSPFALFIGLSFLHTAPEGGLVEVAHGATGMIASAFVVACVAVYVMPLLAKLFIGNRNTQGTLTAAPPPTTSVPVIPDGMSAVVPDGVYRWSRGRAKS